MRNSLLLRSLSNGERRRKDQKVAGKYYKGIESERNKPTNIGIAHKNDFQKCL